MASGTRGIQLLGSPCRISQGMLAKRRRIGMGIWGLREAVSCFMLGMDYTVDHSRFRYIPIFTSARPSVASASVVHFLGYHSHSCEGFCVEAEHHCRILRTAIYLSALALRLNQ